MIISPLTSREMAARSHEARRRNRALREQQAALDDNIALLPPHQPANTIQMRADALDEALERLKVKLREATEAGASQDVLRYAQAIDRLEQSWARYAGVPVAPRKAARRSVPSIIEPL